EYEDAVRDYKAAGGSVDSNEQVVNVLMAMPASYSNTVAALETLEEEELTWDRAKGRLLEAELKLSSKDREVVGETPVAFQSQSKRQPITCFKCAKVGHKADRCRSRFKPKKKSNQANYVDSSSSRNGFAMMVSSSYRKEKSSQLDFIVDSGTTDHIV
ncbi:hypothetical protein, partial [Streptomyces djakartensis]|uniref:hypothetical protein n=1 Tax=Streptomyces djakartensis TaxID=68193 RepID=UPI0034DE8DB9